MLNSTLLVRAGAIGFITAAPEVSQFCPALNQVLRFAQGSSTTPLPSWISVTWQRSNAHDRRT